MSVVKKQNRKKKWYQLWYVRVLIIIGIILFFGVSCCLVYLLCFKTTTKPYALLSQGSETPIVEKIHGDKTNNKLIIEKFKRNNEICYQSVIQNENKVITHGWKWKEMDKINNNDYDIFQNFWKEIDESAPDRADAHYITDDEMNEIIKKMDSQ